MRKHVPAAIVAVALGGFLLAQPGQAKPPKEAIDRVVEALSLQDIAIDSKDRGADVTGRLSDGSRVELEFDRSGRLDEIEAVDDGLFTAASVAAVIPQAVRDSDRYPADGRFKKLEFDDDEVEIEGFDQSGMLFEAEFATDGSLIEWHYDD